MSLTEQLQFLEMKSWLVIIFENSQTFFLVFVIVLVNIFEIRIARNV
jgi:hypothetical protein